RSVAVRISNTLLVFRLEYISHCGERNIQLLAVTTIHARRQLRFITIKVSHNQRFGVFPNRLYAAR
ncbi:MAG: hypothetical protein ABI901_18330, partial [Roseiflexaceae bacterium]